MRQWHYPVVLAVLALAAVGVLLGENEPVQPPTTAPAPAGPDLELQTVALKTLIDLDLTPEQLKSLQQLAADTAAKPGETMVKGSDAYKKALAAYRDALISGDEEKISETQNKIDELRDSEDIEPDTTVDMTDGARRAAPAALKLLTTHQIAGYIGSHAHEVPSPLETMIDALPLSRGKSPSDLATLKKEAGDQVALLMVGVNAEAGKPIAQKVSDWLAGAAKLSEPHFKANREELEASARQIVSDYDPMDGLRHWMEGEMADLLSNPETKAAIAAKLK